MVFKGFGPVELFLFYIVCATVLVFLQQKKFQSPKTTIVLFSGLTIGGLAFAWWAISAQEPSVTVMFCICCALALIFLQQKKFLSAETTRSLFDGLLTVGVALAGWAISAQDSQLNNSIVDRQQELGERQVELAKRQGEILKTLGERQQELAERQGEILKTLGERQQELAERQVELAERLNIMLESLGKRQ